ncbi:MAG: PorT family protein [Sphingobacteriales bacterium]|nr:MAG: PorT family protein [Sphingobacteriales bacterium]
MKKALLLAVAACSITTAVRAQSFYAGLKLGANLSQLNGTSWEDGYKANILGGVYAGATAVRMGVQAEAFFTQTSFTSSGKTAKDFYTNYYNDLKDSAKSGRYRLNQLSVPILFQLKVVGPLWLQIGPQFTANLSVSDKENLLKNPDDIFRKSNIEGVIGASAKLPFKLQVGARYVLGLTDVNNADKVQENWKQRSFQIHVGYSFF